VTAEERLAIAFLSEHPDEAARLLERMDPADAAAVIATLAPPVAADVMHRLAPSSAAGCAAALDDGTLAAIIDGMPLEPAAAVVRGLERPRRDTVLDQIAEERREQLRALLSLPENSAGAIADPLALAVPDDLTVGEAQKQLRGSDQHLFYYVYVVRRDRTLVGALAMPELMAARPKEMLSAVMRRDLVRVNAHLDLATLAVHPAWRDLDALPVVDAAGRLIGAIRHKTIRRVSAHNPRPMMTTIVGLSELYWVGVSGMLASLAPEMVRPAEVDDVTR
jgi:magnesium transporter